MSSSTSDFQTFDFPTFRPWSSSAEVIERSRDAEMPTQNFPTFAQTPNPLSKKQHTRNTFLLIVSYLLINGGLNFYLGFIAQNNKLHWLYNSLQLPVYGFLAYLLASSLGKCPLKWRRMTSYTLLILLAHSYWVLFLLAWLTTSPYQFNWYALGFASIGMIAGIQLRLRYTYKRCDCQIATDASDKPQKTNLIPFSGYSGIKALITHHPELPAIISRSFGWKALFIGNSERWKMNLICTGKSLVSLPHFSYGALFVNSQNTPPDEVIKHLQKMHFQQGFHGLEYRSLLHDRAQTKPAYKISSWLTLQPTPEQQLQLFSVNLRSKIRRGLRQNFDFVSGKEELLNDFYKTYARHMRHLGSGAITKKFFANLLQSYNSDGGVAKIYILRQQNKTIGAAFSLAYEGFYENGWFATHPQWQKQYASYVLHHHMINDAIALSCHTYSFGRSTHDSGVHHFKKQWNTTDIPLNWLSFPEPNLNLRKQSWIRTLWKKLPYPIGNHFGNYIAKWIY